MSSQGQNSLSAVIKVSGSLNSPRASFSPNAYPNAHLYPSLSPDSNPVSNLFPLNYLISTTCYCKALHLLFFQHLTIWEDSTMGEASGYLTCDPAWFSPTCSNSSTTINWDWTQPFELSMAFNIILLKSTFNNALGYIYICSSYLYVKTLNMLKMKLKYSIFISDKCLGQ